MIAIEEALKLVLKEAQDFGTEVLDLQAAYGRILREGIAADRDFPPFDRVTMDGIAINSSSFHTGQRQFKVEGIIAAGSPQVKLENPENCLEVMTGAVMPEGADYVIRYEDLSIADGTAKILLAELPKKQNVHYQAEDCQVGSRLLNPGIRISSAEIGILATVGKFEVEVSRAPEVLVLSSGDELVEINQRPKAHQLRRSNADVLQSLLQDFGVVLESRHLKDELADIKNHLSEALKTYDLILLSGGVSKGKFDFIPQVLEEFEVAKRFHRVAQRPGKPFWFGAHPNGCTIFAFPGNPVSTFACALMYLRPFLQVGLKIQTKDQLYAVLEEDLIFNPELTLFAQVKLSFNADSQISAKPLPGNGSGDLRSLSEADAFMILPSSSSSFKAGESYPILSFRKFY